MRYAGLALAGLVVAWGIAAAQQPGQQPAPGAAPPSAMDKHLDDLLMRWQQTMQNIQTLEAKCSRTTLDKSFGATDVFEGEAKYMKPNLAALHVAKKNRPDVFERFICSGTFLYEFRPQEKLVRAHEMPPAREGQVADDNFLSFLFGMKAEEAKRRYELKLENLEKNDQNWFYIRIFPRFPADKADFSQAQLVLGKANFLPRRLWFQQPNGNEVTWDIPAIDANARLNRNDFNLPNNLPADWKLMRVPRAEASAPANQPPPRVVRPQGK